MEVIIKFCNDIIFFCLAKANAYRNIQGNANSGIRNYSNTSVDEGESNQSDRYGGSEPAVKNEK